MKIDTEQIKIIICIALSMLPILKKDLAELKEACKAKEIKFTIKNTKIILSKYFITLFQRVNHIEDSLIAKGYYF